MHLGITIGQVCRRLGLSRARVVQLDGVLEPRRIEPSGWRLYDEALVDRVAAERRTAAEARRRR
jgi:hypothetical protein